jgi:hypothetical protein
MGGSDGKAVFEGKGVEKLSDAVTLEQMTVTRVGQDILVQGSVNEVEHLNGNIFWENQRVHRYH